ncbi:MAG: CDP-diacylglycerol--glycerol-3-phosphate 3-phosphatidyltransferase [Clostridiales bacterium]|nr:CDP-diacylglycerol--glycerol-3-phosphate 3-phosphatidyltransferase [Clostridiales bacterium]
MNLPNKLSVIRICSVPVLALLLSLKDAALAYYIALFVFIGAAITDFVDGHIARKYDLVTNFGKFIDPVADKLLVLSTMVLLIGHGLLPAWLVVAVLLRELAVDGLRLVAVEQGKVIAAGKLGKIKTVCQMVLVIAHLVYLCRFPLLNILAGWLLIPSQIAALVMTLWSGVDYFLHNKEVLHG